MHVNVHSVLPCGSTDVDADVVAVRRMVRFDPSLRLIEKGLNFSLLCGCHIEVARNVPTRNDQHMAAA
jgi:hypothetical protein